MIILGIETSCDETAAAVVQNGNTILSSVVSSQVAVHHPYGGVVPELASRKHIEAIVAVVNQALLSADMRVAQVKKVIESDLTLIVEKIKGDFPELGFYHEIEDADIEDVEVDNVTISEIRIIHIGGNEVSIAFEATVDYSAYVRADDHSTASIDSSEDWYVVWNEYRGTVNDLAKIAGTAKCSVSPDWNKVEGVLMFEIQEDDIFVEEVPEEIFRKGE